MSEPSGFLKTRIDQHMKRVLAIPAGLCAFYSGFQERVIVVPSQRLAIQHRNITPPPIANATSDIDGDRSESTEEDKNNALDLEEEAMTMTPRGELPLTAESMHTLFPSLSQMPSSSSTFSLPLPSFSSFLSSSAAAFANEQSAARKIYHVNPHQQASILEAPRTSKKAKAAQAKYRKKAASKKRANDHSSRRRSISCLVSSAIDPKNALFCCVGLWPNNSIDDVSSVVPVINNKVTKNMKTKQAIADLLAHFDSRFVCPESLRPFTHDDIQRFTGVVPAQFSDVRLPFGSTSVDNATAATVASTVNTRRRPPAGFFIGVRGLFHKFYGHKTITTNIKATADNPIPFCWQAALWQFVELSLTCGRPIMPFEELSMPNILCSLCQVEPDSDVQFRAFLPVSQSLTCDQALMNRLNTALELPMLPPFPTN